VSQLLEQREGERERERGVEGKRKEV